MTDKKNTIYFGEPPTSPRVEVVDVLRTLAMCGIIIKHFIEGYNFPHLPLAYEGILKPFDAMLYHTVVILTDGKMYIIFALLFGFSFFIQHRNHQARQLPSAVTPWYSSFTMYFSWRMAVLGFFGTLHYLMYNADFLVIYAFTGLLLPWINRLCTPHLLLFAFLFLCNPLNTLYCLQQTLGLGLDSVCTLGSGTINDYAIRYSGSFAELLHFSLGEGIAKEAHFWLFSGRIEQTIGLFALGIYFGRSSLLLPTQCRRWGNIALIAFAEMMLLIWAQSVIGNLFNPLDSPWLGLIKTNLQSWKNLAVALLLLAGVITLFYKTKLGPVMARLTAIGHASMTCYILSSFVGTSLIYGWGCALNKTVGETCFFLMGFVCILVLHFLMSHWLASHKRGPLESLWRSWTRKNPIQRLLESEKN